MPPEFQRACTVEPYPNPDLVCDECNGKVKGWVVEVDPLYLDEDLTGASWPCLHFGVHVGEPEPAAPAHNDFTSFGMVTASGGPEVFTVSSYPKDPDDLAYTVSTTDYTLAYDIKEEDTIKIPNVDDKTIRINLEMKDVNPDIMGMLAGSSEFKHEMMRRRLGSAYAPRHGEAQGPGAR